MPRDAAAFLDYIGDPLAPLAVGAGARKELKIWLLRHVPELRFYDNPAILQQKISNALAIGRSQRVVDGLIDMLTLEEDAGLTKKTVGSKKKKSVTELAHDITAHLVGLFIVCVHSGLEPLDDPPSGISRNPCYVSMLTHPEIECRWGNTGALPRSARHVRPPCAPLAPRAALAGFTQPCSNSVVSAWATLPQSSSRGRGERERCRCSSTSTSRTTGSAARRCRRCAGHSARWRGCGRSR